MANSAWPATIPSASAHCDLFAAPSGSDSAGDGTSDRPFQSLTRLDAALSPGQTGCLRAGTYGSVNTWHKLDSDGSGAGRITIMAFPGELVTVVGWVDLEGSYTTLSHLRIDGSNTFYKHQQNPGCANNVSESLDIAGHDDVLEYDEYYQSVPSLRANGIGIGFWGNAENTVIRYDKIHDVGACMAHDHLIYLASGSGAQIYDNWLWNDSHGRGIQLYPSPTNARIWNNVIDHAGVGFLIGNEPGKNASGNHIWNNIVLNSIGLTWAANPGTAIEVSWGGTPSPGNTFTDNDSYNNPGGVGAAPGVSLSGNTMGNPQLANAANHDYRAMARSRGATWNLWDGQ